MYYFFWDFSKVLSNQLDHKPLFPSIEGTLYQMSIKAFQVTGNAIVGQILR